MALKRPEGLSPSLYSLASPDIPESYIFKWTVRGAGSSDAQARFTIRLWDKTNTTVLRTQTVISSIPQMPMADLNYPFVVGETYYWSVVTYGEDLVASPESVHANFKYDNCPIAPFISWSNTLEQGSLVRKEYLEEIKTNLLLVFQDYFAPPSLIATTQGLFKGNIVPSRTDFKGLEEALRYLYMKTGIFLEPRPPIRRQELIKEGRLWNWDELHQEEELLEEWAYEQQQIEQPIVNVQKPVEDSLGVSDIQAIRDYLNFLMESPPTPVGSMSISFPPASMYSPYDVTAIGNGNTINSVVDITWKVSGLVNRVGYFKFDRISSSDNIRYYRVIFEYGPSSNPFICELYYKATDIMNGTTRSYAIDWQGIYTPETMGLAKESVRVFAIDKRGNVSPPVVASQTYGENFKIPLGVKEYIVEYQKIANRHKDIADIRETSDWFPVYSGKELKTTHRIAGGSASIYYRIKTVDISGLESTWAYPAAPVSFAPTAPPSVPKLTTYASTQTTISMSWEPPTGAEKYQWKIFWGGSVYDTVEPSLLAQTNNGLYPGRQYEMYVRAGNDLGWSSWTSIIARTKTGRTELSVEAVRAKTWNSKRGWVPGHWDYVYQGEDYVGANDPHPYYTGKHKGLWVYNDIYVKEVLAGQRILKTEIWIESMNNNDSRISPTFWLHNYAHDKVPTSGEPVFTNPYQPPEKLNTQHVGWVTLPNYFGERMKDGTAKGIGVYADNWSASPYIKFYPISKLRITYEEM